MDIESTLNTWVNTVKDKPAVTVDEALLREAYGKATAEEIWDFYTPQNNGDVIREEAPGEFLLETPLNRLNMISTKNLEALKIQANRAISTAIRKNMLTAQEIATLLNAVEAVCTTQDTVIVHDPNFEKSAHKGDDFSAVKNSRALRAPKFSRKSDDADDSETLVYCNVMHESDRASNKRHFLIKNPQDALFRRSMFVMDFDHNSNVTLAVGGNHMEVAWRLSSIIQVLEYFKETVEKGKPIPIKDALAEYDIGEKTALEDWLRKSHFVFPLEIIVPKEINLEGQYAVDKNGKETLIVSKITMPKKKSLKPRSSDITGGDDEPKLRT